MIPKIESCSVALNGGVHSTYIINGMRKHTIIDLVVLRKKIGTEIVR